MNRYKILLVEDDKEQAKTLIRLLDKAAPGIFEIFAAHTLADGLRISQEINADLTLLDLQLPDAPDWHVTARAIRDFFPPVIVVTFMPPKEVEVECVAYGAIRVFDKGDVLKVVEALVGEITRTILRVVAPKILAAQNGN